MTRIVGWFAIAVSLCISAGAGVAPGSISGSVKDSSGVAQMGATVEMLAVGTGQHLLAYTDADGHFSITGLTPGQLRPSGYRAFVPSYRSRRYRPRSGSQQGRQHYSEHAV